MGYRVRLLRSGREFTVEGSDTLLESALRAGFNLRYHCANGTCGECLARLVEGQVEQRQAHDFRLGEAARARGEMLMCSVGAASDLVIDADEFDDIHTVPRQNIVTRISRLEHLGPDQMILHLRTPRSQTLQFLAGQHISLCVSGVGASDLYIASCPCNGMNLQFHLVRGDDALVTHLLDAAKVGDSVAIDGPFGEFVLDPDVTRPLVMVAEGEGFAPIKSLIEQAINLELPQRVSLYRMAEAEAGPPYLDNLCRSWVDALDCFDYQVVAAEPTALAETLARRHGEEGGELYLSAGAATRRLLAAELERLAPERLTLRVANAREGRRASAEGGCAAG